MVDCLGFQHFVVPHNTQKNKNNAFTSNKPAICSSNVHFQIVALELEKITFTLFQLQYLWQLDHGLEF